MRNPPHPGRYIEEERAYLDISVQELANALGGPTIEITQLIEERISLTPDMARRLANVIGSIPEMWMRLNHSHRSKRKSEARCRQRHSIPYRHSIPRFDTGFICTIMEASTWLSMP
ncbi:HigA family addiction module antitoxin [Rosenbergiella metrosideri]|uniref:HigA family addiction module antitoxin n=1 Tax=Rosenbergiella metrosideri TaxID=2921185 RepID=UPI003BAC1F73